MPAPPPQWLLMQLQVPAAAAGRGRLASAFPVYVPASHPAPSQTFSHKPPSPGARSSRSGDGTVSPEGKRPSRSGLLAAEHSVWVTLETSRKSHLGSSPRARLWPLPDPDLPTAAQMQENTVGKTGLLSM